MKKIYLYSRYERLWHWFQMFIIFCLVITGFEVHGTYSLLGFGKAVEIHNYVGITWLISFAFFLFWIFTTGEWRQYIPTTKKMYEVIMHYSFGIFKGNTHPYKRSPEQKHNPLQRITYLILASVLIFSQMLTGLLYWSFNSWNLWGLGKLNLEYLAWVHVICSFLIVTFIIVHGYMITTGHTIFAHIKSMLTGWGEE